MELSIVIVNWNTREYLRRCLESIREHPASVGTEVLVVDNASSDGSVAMMRDLFSEVRLIANTENIGYAEGNNQAIAASEGRYVLLLNPDTETKPGSFDALLSFAGEHPDAAAVGCRLVGPDGGVQRSCRSFPAPMPVLWEYLGLSRMFPRSRTFGAYRMTYMDYGQDAEVDQPMGSCLLIRRKAWVEIGSFDKAFPIFFNEVDWCYRAKEQGWKVCFTARAEIIHHGGASTRQARPRMAVESHRAFRRFYEKHYRGRIPASVYWLILTAAGVNSFIVSRLRSIGR